jgi:hypothetical protein
MLVLLLTIGLIAYIFAFYQAAQSIYLRLAQDAYRDDPERIA